MTLENVPSLQMWPELDAVSPRHSIQTEDFRTYTVVGESNEIIIMILLKDSWRRQVNSDRRANQHGN